MVLNDLGSGFCDYAAGVFIQVSLLIILLLILDFMLRKRVRAVFRYCLWMLLFVKLVLPTSFTLPTGIGYWLGDYFPSEVSIVKSVSQAEEATPMVQTEEAVPVVIDMPQWDVIDTPPMNETVPTGVELESISRQGLVFSVWLVGMLALSALLVRRFYFVRRLIANSRPANERSLEMLDECCRRIGIRRNIELRLTNGKLSPAVCGFFKPVILMPAALLQKLSREKLRAVLIHELAHIKRGDAWVNLLQTILQIVYFYNPLVWLANVMVRRAREQAVDEMVLVTLRPETKNYSNMLIDIAEMAFWRPNFSLRIIGVIESKKALERRINHMLTRPVPKSSKLGPLGLIAIVAIGAIILPMGRNSMAEAADTQESIRKSSETNTIVPGVRVGDYTFGMSKDDVLKRLGKPEMIFFGGERYTLDNLPGEYFMSFGDISFQFDNDLVKGIGVHSPFYKFTNGLGIGDPEQKIKQAFGYNFDLKESERKDYLSYEDKGLLFEINKKDRTVIEIGIRRTTGEHGDIDTPVQQEKSKHTIVPGLRVGDYTLDMSKDEVLRRLGEPEAICLDEDGDEVVSRGQEKYDLNNRECLMIYSDISFGIEEDSVEVIMVRSPLYKLSNGLKVGDSEQKIKQTFGEDFQHEEALGRNFRCYHAKGLAFEIHKKNQTVAEIVVYQPQGVRGDSDAPDSEKVALIRKAAADGRIAFKLTTPDEFKAIAGRPTREWVEADDELIYMEYPDIQVEFFGKPEINTPHTLTSLRCEGMVIDIGKNRPIVLRNGGDLDKFGSYWGYSGVDLSWLDLSKKDDILKAMSFDSLTVWPEAGRLPTSFDPEAVMEWGKNPGLGVRSLHKKGITGHGVSIAILDQPLLVDHQEYAERVHLYEEIHIQSGEGPASHGAAVASIAVGKTVGLAPEAELYYVAQWNFDWEKKKFTPTLRYLVQGVHRILEVNKQLPKDNKIRVISISKGWEPSDDGYDDIMAACEEAKAEGIFVVSCSLDRVYGFNFAGLGRNPLAIPDSFESYEPGLFWAKGFYNGRTGFGSGYLLVPMDSRTTASPAGSDEYVFYRQGGLSWSVPYIAGVYTLAVQVEPEITPERFWNLAMKTGRTIELEHKGERHSFGLIIDPVALISALQKK
jgi:beta-lactamase regulating signal transducer with metallopeptidase domain